MSVGACLATAPLWTYALGVAAGAATTFVVCLLKWRGQAVRYRQLLRIHAVRY